MYIIKDFYEIKECLEYADEHGYEIVSIVPVEFKKDEFDYYEAYKYEVIFR